ncbi:hypothetical protein [Pseudooceanicola nitratireducens]|uniref:hypothetical protein n=1 Tax=Pseudooceanicola nitratireducens TaxID=517719 RepID=UPI001C960EA3|nr:hypothetical protein [Pseudooceanicola nitratireducens]MBY6155802.1 hypothetical protein [Pseudooceanicola nitratireducens]
MYAIDRSNITCLPVGPIARRQADGSIIRVIPQNRHLIPMPTLSGQTWYGKEPPDHWHYMGHPEIALLDERLERATDPDLSVPLTEREVMLLSSIKAVLPILIGPFVDVIRRDFSADHLLPFDGRFRTYSQVLKNYRHRDDIENLKDAIRYFHTATMSVQLAEQKIAAWLAEREKRRAEV